MGKLKYFALVLILILILLSGCEYTISEDKTGKSYQVKITEVDKNKAVQGDVEEVKEEGIKEDEKILTEISELDKKQEECVTACRLAGAPKISCEDACQKIKDYAPNPSAQLDETIKMYKEQQKLEELPDEERIKKKQDRCIEVCIIVGGNKEIYEPTCSYACMMLTEYGTEKDLDYSIESYEKMAGISKLKTPEDCPNAVSITNCYYEFAMGWQIGGYHSELCSKIPDETKKDDCYHKIAIQLDDFDLCKNIKGEYLEMNCYTEVAKELDNLKLCSSLDKEKEVKCYKILMDTLPPYKECSFQKGSSAIVWSACLFEQFNLDVSMEDTYLCQIKDITDEERCKAGIALYNKDLSMCDLTTVKAECYIAFAYIDPNFDLSKCDELGEGNGGCYNAVAITTNNAELCKKISTDTSKYYCLSDVALNTVNFAPCKMIADDVGETNLWALNCIKHIINKAISGEASFEEEDCNLLENFPYNNEMINLIETCRNYIK
ncbi:hypothetical protein J4434_06655 [Candidatus Woesearchaeota archaeon]|nr:hypothetical protein [Candidatus Woesearchaeota archaeon]